MLQRALGQRARWAKDTSRLLRAGIPPAIIGFLVLALGGMATSAAPTGLVAAYGFDGGSGSAASDASGNNNTGTISGASWSTSGKFGKSLSFAAGQSAHVRVPDSASLHLTIGMTLEAWVNPSESAGSWRTVIFKERPAGMTYALYSANGTNRPAGQVYTTDELESAGTAPLALNSWTHLATTYDGSALKLYVNGSQVSSAAVSGSIVSSTGLLKIGGNAIWDEWFNGLIDEVRIYNRALTAAEIQTDMNSPIAAADPTPPSAPGTLTATGGPGQVSLSWGAATDNVGVTNYNVYRGASAGFTPSTANRIAQPAGTSYTDSGLAPGSYYYKVAAEDAAGNIGAAGNEANVVVSDDTTPPPDFVVETLVTGLAQPTQILFTPDGRMLILERAGTILVVQPGSTEPDVTPFLSLQTVAMSDERGALGMVLDPEFASNGFIYVMYTHSSLVNRVSRFTAVGNSAPVGSERVIWENDVPAAIYHQGGGLAFGADGHLYISVGDNLDRDSAQSLTSSNGKILRIAGDGTVPTDNPFYDGAGPNDDAIWALGLRNPFRFTFDPATNRMLIADVGEGTWEELNVGVRGANYGWPTCEGACGVAGLTNPIYAYAHNGGEASITGGVVYHGSQFGSAYDGSYFYADYAQNWIKRLTFDGSGNVSGSQNFLPADGSIDGPYGDPVYICEGPDESLYYVDIGPLDIANSGTIRRVRNANGNQPPSVSASANPLSGAPPLSVSFSSTGTSDPEGEPLTYSWTFGDGSTSSQPNPTYVYAASGAYMARLSVSDGVNTTTATPIQIQVGTPPVPQIAAPTGASTFQAGQLIDLAGSATDAEDGTLDDSSLEWVVVFHHEGHQHPGPGPFVGGSAGFTIPSSGHDFTGNTRYEIVLTATDSSGLSASRSVFIYPRKVNVNFDSAPSGLSVVVDSLGHTTPYSVESLIGFHHTVGVASPQSLAGTSYTFTSWSDGGAQTHDIVVPSVDQTYTVTFSANGPSGLVAGYNFDEGGGATVNDVSGNGNDGTISNATWSTAGRHAQALNFNGTNALVTVPDSPSLDLTTGMTLEAWVNPSSLGGVWRSVVFKERPDGMLYSLYASNGEANLPVGQVFLSGAEQNAAGASALPINAWSHLAATYDGASLRMYVDGTSVRTLAISGSLANTTNPLRIGGNSIWGEHFHGLIDDVRIYDRALSAAEIQGDMAAAVGSG